MVAVMALACDDGNIEIETLDFESGDPQSCDGISVTGANVLFKINGDEALILELPANAIKNEVSDGSLTFAVPGTAQVTYRLFSDTVSNTYFCSEIPVTSPTVLDEIEAVNGTVRITTSSDDGTTFTHTIELLEISLLTSSNTRITDLRINNFGEVTTN